MAVHMTAGLVWALFCLVSAAAQPSRLSPGKNFTCKEGGSKQLYHTIFSALSWSDGRAACHKYGMVLATVRTPTETGCMVEAMLASQPTTDFWASGVKTETAGSIVVDALGHPSYFGIPHLGKGCLSYRSKKWRISNCSLQLATVCQQLVCLPGWIRGRGSCYKQYEGIQSLAKFADAVSRCKLHPSAHVVQTETHQEAVEVSRLRAASLTWTWLGARRNTATHRTAYTWLSSNKTVSNRFWAPKQPSGSVDCLATGAGEKSVYASLCSGQLRVMCELELCSSGWTRINDYCMKLFETSLNQPAATKLCHSQKFSDSVRASLLSIESAREAQEVYKYFLNGTTRNVWLGLQLDGGRFEYRWTESGERLEDFDYRNWAEGEPNGRVNAKETCVEIGTQHNNGKGAWKWNDVGCNHTRYVVCQHNQLYSYGGGLTPHQKHCPPAPDAPERAYRSASADDDVIRYRCNPGFVFSDNREEIQLRCFNGKWDELSLLELEATTCQEQCQAGWTRYKEHCYYFQTASQTQAQAYQACRRNSSYLVEVFDSEEAAFLSDLASWHGSPGFYIGLTDKDAEGVFIWDHSRSDVRQQAFNQWAGGVYPKPQSDTHHEFNDCVTSYRHKWIVSSCSPRHAFVCEREKEVSTCPQNRSVGVSRGSGERVSVATALTRCKADFALLPILDSVSTANCLTVQRLVTNATATPTSHLRQWLGLTQDEEDGQYKWLFGEKEVELAKSQARWAVGEPRTSVGVCVVSDANKLWYAESCSARHLYQCQHDLLAEACPPPPPTPTQAGVRYHYSEDETVITAVTYECWEDLSFHGFYGSLTGSSNRSVITLQCVNGAWAGAVPKECIYDSCVAGFQIFEGQCYKIHQSPTTLRTASSQCFAEGASLASVALQRQEDYLAHLVGSTARGRNGAWISLNDVLREGVYRWGLQANAPVLAATSYRDWGFGQPDNAGTHGEHCVELRGGGWNDVPCEAKRRFVCTYDTEAASCPYPLAPVNGNRTGDSFQDFDSVYFACQTGFVLTPALSATLTCFEEDGQYAWDGVLPSCIESEGRCDPSLHGCGTSAECSFTQHGKAVCYCPFGYTGDGKTCKEIPCPRLPAAEHGHWLDQSAVAVSSIAKLVCESGYVLANIDLPECVLGGAWDPPTAKCVKHGQCPVCNQNEICAHIDGKAACVCSRGVAHTADGEAYCREASCRELPEQVNGDLIGSFHGVNDTVLVWCDAGYTLHNKSEFHDQTLTCAVVDGQAQWDALPLPCVDVNECADLLLCDDGRCINEPGSYECVPSAPSGGGDSSACNIQVETQDLFIQNAGFEVVWVPHNSTPTSGIDIYCDEGYTLDSSFGYVSCEELRTGGHNGPNCVDIDECLKTAHGCHGECRNIPGSYQCRCGSSPHDASLIVGPDTCFLPVQSSTPAQLVHFRSESEEATFYGVVVGVPLAAMVIISLLVWRLRIVSRQLTMQRSSRTIMSRLVSHDEDASSSSEQVDDICLDEDDDIALLQ